MLMTYLIYQFQQNYFIMVPAAVSVRLEGLPARGRQLAIRFSFKYTNFIFTEHDSIADLEFYWVLLNNEFYVWDSN